MEKKYEFRGEMRSISFMLSCLAPHKYEGILEVPSWIKLIRIEGTDTIIAASFVSFDPSQEHLKYWYMADSFFGAYPYEYYRRTSDHDYDDLCADVMTEEEVALFLNRGATSAAEMNEKHGSKETVYEFFAWRLLPTHLTDKEAELFAATAKEDVEYEGIEDDSELERYISAYEISDMRAKEVSARREFANCGKNIWCNLLDMESVHKVMTNL